MNLEFLRPRCNRENHTIRIRRQYLFTHKPSSGAFSLGLLHDDYRTVQLRFGEAVVRVAFGNRLQPVFRNAVLVHQQVVNILHALLAELLVELLRPRRVTAL